MQINIIRRRTLCGLLAALPLGMAHAHQPSTGTTGHYAAEVRRTAFGVPHIKAANEAGLGYGVGYAYAQDNVCVLAEAIVTDDGERSKYFGPEGREDPFVDGMGGDGPGNLASDFYFKYLNAPALVQAHRDSQPDAIKDLLKGYAAGYNRYLRETGVTKLPQACRGQPWVREITHLDLVRLMRRYSTMASGGAAPFMRAFAAAQPPAVSPHASTTASKDVHALSGAELAAAIDRSFAGLNVKLGSNGVALGKDATQSGKGLLLANPHFPWHSVARFYQLHLTIPSKVDVMGASLQGLPVVNIGFNANVAWTHTVNTSRHFNVYMLALDPADPTRYLMDGQSKPMQRQELSVESTTNGVTTVVKRTFYASEHGPIVVMTGTMDWSRERAFALADAAVGNDRSFEQWWAMDRADSVAALKHSVETIVGLGWVNVLAAGRDGTVYFGDVTAVPNISASKEAACVPEPLRPYMARGVYILAGHVSACNWDIDPAAPQKGIVAGASLPQLVRTDYVQNSNDSAWMSNPKQPLTGFPSIVSKENKPLNGRTRIGVTQIVDRLDGRDGLPGNKFDLKSLQKIAFSNEAYFARSLLPGLLEICRNGAANIGKGCAVLREWDGKASLDSIGWPLFQQWQIELMSSGVNFWDVSFDPADPVNTPRGLKLADQAVAAAAVAALGRAMEQLDKLKIDYRLPWGKIQMTSPGKRRIPIDGGSNLRGTEQTYNLQDSKPAGDGTLVPFNGSSFVLTVSFEGRSPLAQGFLVPSESSDPDSVHSWDQTERFSRKKWITFPFTENEIRHDVGYTSTRIVQ
jgi:acyl-homoserine-lactone acylase